MECTAGRGSKGHERSEKNVPGARFGARVRVAARQRRERASLHPPQAALRRCPRRPWAGDRMRKGKPAKVSPSHSPFLAVCGSAGNRYSCHAAKAAWQLSFPGVLSPDGSVLSAIPSAPETRSPGASAGSAVSTALQGGPHSPYPARTSARTCW